MDQQQDSGPPKDVQGLHGPTKSDEAPGPGAGLGLDLPPSLKSPHVKDEADRFDSQGNYQLVHDTWVRAMQGVAARSEIEGMQGLLSDTGYRLGERDLHGTSINGQVDDATYAQGRSKPGIRVTNAKGGESYHNFKLAYDVALRDKNGKYVTNGSDPAYRDAAKLGQRYGLEWGGNFHSKFDAPHYQYSKDMSLPDLRLQYPVGHGRQGPR
jgi:hypothetical protein